ncbi:hypothetical protein BDV11DRAFT_198736 [Aspergillus similis]
MYGRAVYNPASARRSSLRVWCGLSATFEALLGSCWYFWCFEIVQVRARCIHPFLWSLDPPFANFLTQARSAVTN